MLELAQVSQTASELARLSLAMSELVQVPIKTTLSVKLMVFMAPA